MQWDLRYVAEAVGGRLAGPPADEGTTVSGLSIDSRNLRPGELFVALRADRDGHDFAAAATAAGAAALLVERETGAGVAEIFVGDTAAALLDLGRAARRRLGGRSQEALTVVGITGSVGKTSTKDLAAAALAAGRRTVASERSFNNEIGLPLTLANAPDGVEAVVLEMGARGPGHIALLCDVGRPTVGVVTAVAAAHIEMFGDLAGVARAKGELVEALPPDGTAVLNGDDPRTRAMAARTSARVILYSARGAEGGPAEVVAEGVSLDEQLRPSFTVRSPWGPARVQLEARGAHQVGNALAALSVAASAGVGMEVAAAALGRATLSPLRMEVLRTPSGAALINDAYNANPASMAAALEALVAMDASRRVAVLGEMAELGADGPAEHRAVAARAEALGVEVLAIGTAAYGTPPLTIDEVVGRLGEAGADTAVLVKASRVAALERVATRLMAPPGTA
jgi:UDP-N-acetylmuramoyl-tripeptide--D-alanyl-D-alanine ligase